MAKLRTHTQEVGMVRYIPKLTSLAQQFQPFSKRYGKAAYIYIQPRTITNRGEGPYMGAPLCNEYA